MKGGFHKKQIMQKGAVQKMIRNEQAAVFCGCYARLGNIREAALQAGFSEEEALDSGMRILQKRKYQQLIRSIRAALQEDVQAQVMCGLRRLALGSCNDAVRLVMQSEELSEEEIMRLDLTNVSELKRVKGGGVEVKLFDRQKALEKMMEYAGNADQRAAARSLLSALAGADEDGV